MTDQNRCHTTCDTHKYFVGDIGTEILADVNVDITTATIVKLLVLKPGANSRVEWIGGCYDTHYVRYVVQAGDFNVAGEYQVQAWVQLPGGSWYGREASFRVWPTLPSSR